MQPSTWGGYLEVAEPLSLHGSSGALDSYTAASMAVPKKKTSKSRRDKRRAQHGIEAPRLNLCPQCGRPKRPHRVCPTCHTYRGRDVEPLRTPAP
jgi:large subunit ribosomal protein L32